MRDQRRLLHVERFEQRVRIARELLEAVLVARRLGRFAETDLVRRDHAIAGVGQRLDGLAPRRRAKVLAVQQHSRAAVRMHVHVRHAHDLALRRQRESRDRIGIVEALQLGAVGGAVVAVGLRCGIAGERRRRERECGERRYEKHGGQRTA
jgi:hypothetical protein